MQWCKNKCPDRWVHRHQYPSDEVRQGQYKFIHIIQEWPEDPDEWQDFLAESLETDDRLEASRRQWRRERRQREDRLRAMREQQERRSA